MFSYVMSFFNYLFSKKVEDDDDDKEDYLTSQILELEANENQDVFEEQALAVPEIPRNAVCFQRTGIISYIGENYVLIDGMLYFDISACSINIQLNDKVVYLGYKDANDSIRVARILENQGLFWGDEKEIDENSFQVITHVIVGEVDYKQDRNVYMKDSDLKFNLDNVEGTFIPIKGDWLELKCTVQYDEDKPSNISASQVLQVISFKPLRSLIKSAIITESNGESGICDRQIYFNKQFLDSGFQLHIGSKVMVEAIESNQGTCTWRVIKLIPIDCGINGINNLNKMVTSDQSNEEDLSLKLERERNIEVSYPIKFESVDFHKTEKMTINITNNSEQVYTLNKWIILSKKRDSQINVKPFLTQPVKVHPKQSFYLTVACCPKFLGNARECLILMFKGFQVKRFIEINIVDNSVLLNSKVENGYTGYNTNMNKKEMMKNIRRNSEKKLVPGVKPIKPPAFIPVRLGNFPIPEKVWSVLLGDSDQAENKYVDEKITQDRIEMVMPCLLQDLNIYNYTDHWHSLIHMEEVEGNLNMRQYDRSKVFLLRFQEYLCLEVNGLSEKRPSIIKGDRVIVKDVWDPNSAHFEGFVHNIQGELILMKFNQYFHETYSGSDVSVEFHFSRTIYRRSHQAINLAMSNLGPSILFPSRLLLGPQQLANEKLNDITWFNKKLNTGQKTAIINILKGECRPMPYCIFGPPGTGKTITVVELILQILTNLPHSRILVATPSNSAANLITERLIQYSNVLSGSIVRIIAQYLVDSDSIPEIIKPFCATMDIARENTSKSKHTVIDGIQLNCQTSQIGRHRVSIGTCYSLGALAQMGLPKGHFTHVIIDEAGQTTEPEIMIPLTFIDKDQGQIILAGDPMQLGPVVLSKYSKFYGMDVSFLERILETFPYQKDFDSFENGFNEKVVTKLNDSYRSLEEVLKLSSELFYDGSLVAKLDRSQLWISKTLQIVGEVCESPDSKTGGIYVFGIRGYNARAEDSPSWYNSQEASMLALTTCKLYRKGLTADDIGVITPYIAQIKYLRLLFDAMGLPQPKIGTIEEFQGQEKTVILLSTVRSTEAFLEEDRKHTLGFVNNPKRLNVALTRAQIAVILFCNPHLLCRDNFWNQVITRAVKEEKYMGCDLPEVFCDNINK